MVEKYLVTGANGYIASHVVDQLLKQGHYVRGTVRSLDDKEKVDALKSLGPVEIVEANLLDDESLRKAVKGIDIVMHVASPIPSFKEENDEESFIKPAVEGTLSVLRAALNENVKRVVVTSSAATIVPLEQEARAYTENDWIEVDKIPKSNFSGYLKSKVLAERAAWNFVQEQRKNGGKCFELATIIPSMTFGPILTPQARSSVYLFLQLFNKTGEKVDDFVQPTCDVRDVALAHLRAAQLEEAAGKRYLCILSKKLVGLSTVGKILREAGYQVADVKEKEIIDSTFDDSNTRNVLKIEPTDLKKSVLDTAESLVKFGIIQK